MIAAYLKANLEALHTESFAWAVHCCYKDQAAAEEVLQLSYLKILEGKAKFKLTDWSMYCCRIPACLTNSSWLISLNVLNTFLIGSSQSPINKPSSSSMFCTEPPSASIWFQIFSVFISLSSKTLSRTGFCHYSPGLRRYYPGAGGWFVPNWGGCHHSL